MGWGQVRSTPLRRRREEQRKSGTFSCVLRCEEGFSRDRLPELRFKARAAVGVLDTIRKGERVLVQSTGVGGMGGRGGLETRGATAKGLECRAEGSISDGWQERF